MVWYLHTGAWTAFAECRIDGQAVSLRRAEAGTEYQRSEHAMALQKYGESPIHGLMSEVSREWPELWHAAVKLASGAQLSKNDEVWIREVSEATGWNSEDVVEELRNAAADPSERAERYRRLFEDYLEEAMKRFDHGDYRQAGEKIYGASLALIKLYAAMRGVPVIHWSLGKVEKFITSSVEAKHRELFRGLLDKALRLHEHFHEGHLDDDTFRERWEEALKLLRRAREVVLK